MGKNGLKWEFGLVFYKFAENREFLIGRLLPYKLGIETPAISIGIDGRATSRLGRSLFTEE